MRINPIRLAAICTLLTVSTMRILGAENTTTNATTSAPKSAAPAAPPSRGLLNDWLAEQSPKAKAWDIGGQVRLRYELKDNAGSFPNRDFISRGQDNDNDYLLLREKVHLGYTPASWTDFYIEGRDSASHSDDRNPSPDEDSFDLHQAYIVLGDPKAFPLSLKVGRQGMNYGDERFIGVSDWINTERVFDLAKLRFENESLWVDAFVGRVVIPRDDHFNEANDYDWFSGIYASSRSIIPKQETQIYFLARNVESRSPNAIGQGIGGPGPRDIYTPGLRVRSTPGQFGGWDYGTEIAFQFGRVSSARGSLDHEAMIFDVLGGYTWKDAFGSPRLGVEYTYGSGDSNPTDDKNETVELLFGTNHKLYGVMDLFGLRNMHSPSLSFTMKPAKALTMRLDYLLFWLADDRDFLYPESGAARAANGYGRNPQFDSFVGSELELVLSYQPTKWADFQLGFGHFFVGDYIKQSVESVPANDATDANWLYVQARFNF